LWFLDEGKYFFKIVQKKLHPLLAMVAALQTRIPCQQPLRARDAGQGLPVHCKHLADPSLVEQEMRAFCPFAMELAGIPCRAILAGNPCHIANEG
jgi:hypothetical protein